MPKINNSKSTASGNPRWSHLFVCWASLSTRGDRLLDDQMHFPKRIDHNSISHAGRWTADAAATGLRRFADDASVLLVGVGTSGFRSQTTPSPKRARCAHHARIILTCGAELSPRWAQLRTSCFTNDNAIPGYASILRAKTRGVLWERLRKGIGRTTSIEFQTSTTPLQRSVLPTLQESVMRYRHLMYGVF